MQEQNDDGGGEQDGKVAASLTGVRFRRICRQDAHAAVAGPANGGSAQSETACRSWCEREMCVSTTLVLGSK